MKTLLYGLLVTLNPVSGWQKIADHAAGLVPVLLLHTLPYALIPAVCWYVGVTQVGWAVAGDLVRLTPESALPMCAMFFLAMVAGVIFLGYMVHWMAESYGSASTVAQGVTLITYTATPFFIAGFLGLHPVLWLDIMVGLPGGLLLHLPAVSRHQHRAEGAAGARFSLRQRRVRRGAGLLRRAAGCYRRAVGFRSRTGIHLLNRVVQLRLRARGPAAEAPYTRRIESAALPPRLD